MNILFCFPTHTGAEGSWSDGDEPNGYANIGEEISCIYKIKNSGTQTLSEFCLVDHKIGTDCIDCQDGDVSPGEKFSCLTSFEVPYSWGTYCAVSWKFVLDVSQDDKVCCAGFSRFVGGLNLENQHFAVCRPVRSMAHLVPCKVFTDQCQ